MTQSITETKSVEETVAQTASQEQRDLLDQLLKPEVQQSLTALVEQLPKLTELLNILNKTYDFAQLVATDDVLKNDTVGAITEMMDPITKTVKGIAANAIEAKDRAEGSNEIIGIFGLLRLLKDPQAQKLFRFVQAYLQVAAEREQQK